MGIVWEYRQISRGVVIVSALALIIAGIGSKARAQRPVRITLGLTRVRQTFESYSFTGAGPFYETVSPRYLQLGASYDVLRRGKPGKQAHVFGAVYYDWAVNIDGYGGGADGGTYDPLDFAYSGGGFAVRTHNTFGYVGVGLGSYRSGIGGKLFAGLQGRGSLFAEVALTRTAHDPPAKLTALIGVRL